MKYFEAGSLSIPRIGQGCMGIGGEFSKDSSQSEQHIAALELGIELGMTFLDTAEVYAAGYSEEIVGKVARGKRDKLFIATKFSPENHEYDNVIQSAEKSLRRLQTDYIDLYQIHWPNPKVPISETIQAMEDLVDSGKVRYLGLCNFSSREMSAAQSTLGKHKIVSNQVEYNLFDRFVEGSILPYCQSEEAFIIAYSPLDKGRTTDGDVRRKLLKELAVKYDRTPPQIALNWLTSQPSVVAIPKSINLQHIRQNAASVDFELKAEDKELINRICSSEPDWVDPDHIRVSLEGEGNRKVYQTREEALANALGMSPSPLELAEFIREGEPIKPVRLIPSKNPSGRFSYDLIEGRLRYWAWVIAFDGKEPVPSYIRSA
jgi:diketogulonate reductase-like aldo/keto reductase